MGRVQGIRTDNNSCPICGDSVSNFHDITIYAGKSLWGKRYERVHFCSGACQNKFISSGRLDNVNDWEAR